MLVEAILDRKVVTVDRDHTVLRAARLMRDHNVGCIVVVDDKRRPIGMVTDRDIAVKAVAAGLDLESAVDEVMSSPVYAVSENSLIFDTLREMARRHVHRMPVINRHKKLVGIVTVDDALLLLTTEVANVADVMANRRQRGS